VRDPIVVVAPEEIDPATVGEFRDCLTSVDPGGIIEVDCSNVSFIDSSGVRELILAVARAAAAGGQVWVTNPTAVVRRLLEVTDLAHLITEH
jgi:anti-anti-sigma factor